MSETITLHPASRGVDDDGRPIPSLPDREIIARKVEPVAREELSDQDISGGLEVLRVWCASGVVVDDRDEVTIRGRRYRVRFRGWDWGRQRRPVLARHRPGTVFDAARGEG